MRGFKIFSEIFHRNRMAIKVSYSIFYIFLFISGVLSLFIMLSDWSDVLSKYQDMLSSKYSYYAFFVSLIIIAFLLFVTLRSLQVEIMDKLKMEVQDRISEINNIVRENNSEIRKMVTLPYLYRVKKIIDQRIQAQRAWENYNISKFNSAKERPPLPDPLMLENTTGYSHGSAFKPLPNEYKFIISIDREEIYREADKIIERSKEYKLDNFRNEPQIICLSEQEISIVEKYRRSKILQVEAARLTIEALEKEKLRLLNHISNELEHICPEVKDI